MSDGLWWVEKLATAREGDPAVQAMLDNPGWRLLHVTGGLHTPIEYVFGWPAPDGHVGVVPMEDGE